ncbi:MAG: hypothetical protein U1E83_06625 [Methylotetracoccus sp.]
MIIRRVRSGAQWGLDVDLLDFEAGELYFDGPDEPDVGRLLAEAASVYAEGGAEAPLLSALAKAPQSLSVMVALYRFYYYQHRLEDALQVARRALALTSERLGLPEDWLTLDDNQIGSAALRSMTLLRFHLLALKAAAYLQLRLGDEENGKRLLRRLVQIDSRDRLGARSLLEVAESRLRMVG